MAGSCRPGPTPAPSSAVGDLTIEDRRNIRAAVRDKYARVSLSAAGKFQYPTGREGASTLGYDQALLNSLPPEILVSFCGVGNPFGIARIEPGSAVLDVGCGSGFDLLVARLQVGDSGRVCGIDLTEEMVARARANLVRAGFDDVQLKHVDTDDIPYANASFGVVISNGVINLSTDKEQLFAENPPRPETRRPVAVRRYRPGTRVAEPSGRQPRSLESMNRRHGPGPGPDATDEGGRFRRGGIPRAHRFPHFRVHNRSVILRDKAGLRINLPRRYCLNLRTDIHQ